MSIFEARFTGGSSLYLIAESMEDAIAEFRRVYPAIKLESMSMAELHPMVTPAIERKMAQL